MCALTVQIHKFHLHRIRDNTHSCHINIPTLHGDVASRLDYLFLAFPKCQFSVQENLELVG